MGNEEWKPGKSSPIVGELLRRIDPGRESIVELVKDLTSDEPIHRVEFSQKVIPAERQESPAREHMLYSVDGVISYLGKYKTPNTVILADVAEGSMSICIDETAKTGVEVLRFVPQIHPLFAPWDAAIAAKEMPVEKFAQFLFQNRELIQDHDGKELALLFSQVRASTKTTVDRGRGPKAINGIVCETTIQGQAKQEQVDFPESVTVLAPSCTITPSRADAVAPPAR